MRAPLCGIALACVASAAPAVAQSVLPERALSAAAPSATSLSETVLSEAAALSRLSADSPRVRAIRAAVAIADADAATARRLPNPVIASTRETAAGVTEVITAVAQPLPIVTGRRAFEISAAHALVEAATSRADEGLRRARAELRLAYADLAAAQVRERELARARDAYAELTVVLARREAAGDASGFDRLRAERERLEAETDRLTAAVDRRRAQGALAAFFADASAPETLRVVEPQTGNAATDAATGSAAPSTRAPLPALDGLVTQAEGSRGELDALRHEQDAARLSVRAADRRRLPEPEVVAGTKTSSAGATGGVFGVQATLPLFDRGRAERGTALARAALASARVDAFRVALRAQVATAYDTVTARRTAADAYRATSSRLASDIERIARVSYDAGERGLLDLIDAQRSAAAARLRQNDLDHATRQAEIDLEFLTGWEIQ
jgi:cobalt-zinc-cadmium efflux system outer membrane protein